MKKHIYLLLPLLTLAPTLATQKVINSLFIASTLALSPTTQQPSPNTQPPRNLHDLDEKYILNLILNNSLRKTKIKKHLPSALRGLIHTFFIHEWTIHRLHKDTGTTYDPHGFDINGIHKQTKTNLNPRGFTQNGDYKDVSPTTGKPTKYDLQGYNIDRWNKDGLHENGTKVNNQGFAQQTNHASIHLHKAIDNLDKQALTLLLKNPNINVNLQNNKGWAPLTRCCQEGQKSLPIAQLLLKHQYINVNLQDNDGFTPLIWCAWKGDDALPIAQELLKHQHINVNLQDNNGWTPLIMCCQEGQKSLPIAQLLLKHKHINVNLQDNDGFTPLIWCCKTGDDALYIAQELLKDQHINVNLHKYGDTPLDNIIYWIKQNKKNYQYVQLWNLLAAQGGILNKRKADYENLNPSDFKEPQKSYVQAIKNGPVMIMSLKLSSLTQENERLRTQLEKLQKTSTQQLDHKNNTINTHLKKISSLQEHSDNLKHTFATFQQALQQKTRSLKDHTKKTLQQKNETIKNYLNTIDNQKNIIQHKEEQIQYFTNQLSTTKQPLQHQIPQDFLSQKYTMQNPLVALLTISDYATSPKKIPNLPLVIKDEEILQNIFQKKYHYTTLTPCKKLNYAVNIKNFDKALKTIRTEIENNYYDEKDKYDGLIFVYNGHGQLNNALLSDGKKYLMTKICEKFDNRALDFWLGKPRIIIKLACRGSDRGESISKNPNPRPQKQTIWHCEDQDFISIYANTEGKIFQQSIDTKNNKGSAFVEAFDRLTNFDITFQKDLGQILKMLGNKVRKIMQGTECLEWKTTFFDTLYLTKNNHLNKQLSIQDQNENKEDE